MKYKLIIFDFDGTLADSFPWLIGVADHLADKYRFKRLDKGQLETLRGYDADQMIRLFRVPFWKLILMGRDIRAWMARDVHQIPAFEGVDRLLRRLSEKGVPLAIVTSNSYQNVRQVLGPENAARIRYFECGVSVFGKTAKFRKLLKKSGTAPHEAFCVGDEIRDIHAAKRAGIAFGAVAWGYARVEALQAHAPDEVFSSMDDIIEKIS